jgi:hypothetical protein
MAFSLKMQQIKICLIIGLPSKIQAVDEKSIIMHEQTCFLAIEFEVRQLNNKEMTV